MNWKSKYQAGDRVVVRSDLVIGGHYQYDSEEDLGVCTWFEEKEELIPSDRVVVIREVDFTMEGYAYYHIVGDPMLWTFIDAFFDGLADDLTSYTEINEESLYEILLS